MTNDIKNGGAMENIFVACLKFCQLFMTTSIRGLGILVRRHPDWALVIMMCWGANSTLMVFANNLHLRVLYRLAPHIFNESFLSGMLEYGKFFHILLVFLPPMLFIGFVLGIRAMLQCWRPNQDLKHIGLKTATGETPRVISVEHLKDTRVKYVLSSKGIGLDQYDAKKGSLETAWGMIIESIKPCENNRRFVEIYLTPKEIPKMVKYHDCSPYLKGQLGFLVGESRMGLIVKTLKALPHLLISGTTGQGKSNIFKLILLCILKCTKHIQVYILDLKKGVEASDFNGLKNVKIAKDENEAVSILSQVREEMMRRFTFMESRGVKSIDSVRDKKDIIVIAVDEASELYAKGKMNKDRAHQIAKARELTEEISKLGRAAGVHLILATQKVTTETIDTKIQENLGGRICFRANTLQGSTTVLGNKMAYELPDIKGRAIWANGTEFTEVQTPFLDDETLISEIDELKKEHEHEKYLTFQPMIEISQKLTENISVQAQSAKTVTKGQLSDARNENSSSSV